MLKTVSYNLLFLIVGLFAIEAIFGGWFKDSSFSSINLPRDISVISDVSDLYDRSEPVRYTRDIHGLRGVSGAVEEIDILTIGGSTTNELYIDDCCTWPEMLERKLKGGGIDLEVANAGVDGQSTVGHIWNFDNWLNRINGLKPDYVMAFIGLNDIKIAADDSGESLPYYTDGMRALKQSFRNNSAVYTLYRTIKGITIAHRENLAHGKIDFAAEEKERVSLPDFEAMSCNAEQVGAYARRVGILEKRIREFGAIPVFVTQMRGDSRQTGGTIEGVVRTGGIPSRRNLECHNRELMRLCAENGWGCIDLSDGSDLDIDDFYDALHTNQNGSGKVADTIFEARNLWLAK